jgi:hypothetical protein
LCICGRSDAIGGRTHTCRHPDGPRWSSVNQHAAKPETVANETGSASRLANDPANINGSKLANDAPGRNRASTTYRYRNPDKRRLYMRDLMRRRRATARAA